MPVLGGESGRSVTSCRLPQRPTTRQRYRPFSARAICDSGLCPEILRVWVQNPCVYGGDKIWEQMNTDGIGVARCSVERLMGLRV